MSHSRHLYKTEGAEPDFRAETARRPGEQTTRPYIAPVIVAPHRSGSVAKGVKPVATSCT